MRNLKYIPTEVISFNNIIRAHEDVVNSAPFKGAINCPMKEELLEQIAKMKEIKEELFPNSKI